MAEVLGEAAARFALMSLKRSRFFHFASPMKSASTSLEYSVVHVRKVSSVSVTATKESSPTILLTEMAGSAIVSS